MVTESRNRFQTTEGGALYGGFPRNNYIVDKDTSNLSISGILSQV